MLIREGICQDFLEIIIWQIKCYVFQLFVACCIPDYFSSALLNSQTMKNDLFPALKKMSSVPWENKLKVCLQMKLWHFPIRYFVFFLFL